MKVCGAHPTALTTLIWRMPGGSGKRSLRSLPMVSKRRYEPSARWRLPLPSIALASSEYYENSRPSGEGRHGGLPLRVGERQTLGEGVHGTSFYRDYPKIVGSECHVHARVDMLHRRGKHPVEASYRGHPQLQDGRSTPRIRVHRCSSAVFGQAWPGSGITFSGGAVTVPDSKSWALGVRVRLYNGLSAFFVRSDHLTIWPV